MSEIKQKDIKTIQKETEDKKANLKNSLMIFLTAAGIIGSFIFVGYFAEYLSRTKFTANEESFKGTSALVFYQTLFSTIVAFIVIRLQKGKIDFKAIPVGRFIIQSSSYCFGMFFSYRSLLYVDYPTQIIAKFMKPVVVLLFSILHCLCIINLQKLIHQNIQIIHSFGD